VQDDLEVAAGQRRSRLGDGLRPADDVELAVVRETLAEPVEPFALSGEVDAWALDHH
jgi:hypothetical protein